MPTKNTLDQWPALFKGVATLENKGANLAPWNLANYDVRLVGGRVRVDGDELVFFHFHGFQPINRWLYDPRLKRFAARPNRALRRHVFLPYWQALQRAQRQIHSAGSSPLVPEGLRHVAREGEAAKPSSPWQHAWAKISRSHGLLLGVARAALRAGVALAIRHDRARRNAAPGGGLSRVCHVLPRRRHSDQELAGLSAPAYRRHGPLARPRR